MASIAGLSFAIPTMVQVIGFKPKKRGSAWLNGASHNQVGLLERLPKYPAPEDLGMGNPRKGLRQGASGEDGLRLEVGLEVGLRRSYGEAERERPMAERAAGAAWGANSIIGTAVQTAASVNKLPSSPSSNS